MVETAVWPIPFLINVLAALKGSQDLIFIYGLESRLGVWSGLGLPYWSGFLKWNPGGKVSSGTGNTFFRIQRNIPIWVFISIIAIPCSNRLSKIMIYQDVHE